MSRLSLSLVLACLLLAVFRAEAVDCGLSDGLTFVSDDTDAQHRAAQLFWACSESSVECFDAAFVDDAVADLAATDGSARTLLHVCGASEANGHFVPKLLESGAKPQAVDADDRTPLMTLLYSTPEAAELASSLIGHVRHELEAVGYANYTSTVSGRSAVHTAASAGADVAVLRVIVEAGADPCTPDAHGDKPAVLCEGTPAFDYLETICFRCLASGSFYSADSNSCIYSVENAEEGYGVLHSAAAPHAGYAFQYCQAGTYSSADKACTACPVNAYQPAIGMRTCLDCPAGSTTTFGAATCTVRPRYYLRSGSFVGIDAVVASCDPGYACAGSDKDVVNAGRTACTDAGYSGLGAKECLTCDAGSFTSSTDGTGNDACTLCPAGHACPNGDSKSDCTGAKYTTGGVAACDDCPAGSYVVPDSTTGATNVDCKACDAGKFQPVAGKQDCLACPAGTDSNQDHTSCAVKPGYYLSSGSIANGDAVLLPCEAGYVCAGSADPVIGAGREPCKPDKYQSAEGQTTCNTCPVHTTSQTAAAACDVLPGFYLKAGSFQTNDADVAKCDAGFACHGCTDCELNTGREKCTDALYSANEGATNCTSCPAGSYTIRLTVDGGNVGCPTCLPGFACPGEGRRNRCSGADQWSKAGATSCSTCASGSYVTVDRDQHTGCEVCEAGHACENGAKTTCPAETYAPKGSDKCMDCAKGYHSHAEAAKCTRPVFTTLGARIGFAVAGVVVAGCGIAGALFVVKRRKQPKYSLLDE